MIAAHSLLERPSSAPQGASTPGMSMQGRWIWLLPPGIITCAGGVTTAVAIRVSRRAAAVL